MESKPSLKKIESRIISGISTRTNNKNEMQSKTAQIPQLWTQFYAQNRANEIAHLVKDSPIYGVYHQYDSDMHGDYSVTAGVAVELGEPDKLDTIEIPAGKYLVFSGQGEMPQVVINTWQQIWGYFAERQELSRRYSIDFEEYHGPDKVLIHIAVK